MPSKPPRSEPASVGRRSKRQAGDISSSKATPVRQSGRVKKAISTLSKGPLKKKRRVSSGEDVSDENSDSQSVSDFKDDDSEVEEENGKADDDDDDDVPQSYSIPLPKARDAGDTPYEDSRIHPNTFLFLKDLKANNNRDWLKC
jgi:hypothetical protein